MRLPKIPKNWRTTAAGMLGAAAVAIQPLVTGGVLDGKTLSVAAAIAALGYLSKDAGVSGVTK